jgi:hypothetical protein
MKQYGGSIHERNVITVRSSPPDLDCVNYWVMNVVDMREDSFFGLVVHRVMIAHTHNNWICSDFND